MNAADECTRSAAVESAVASLALAKAEVANLPEKTGKSMDEWSTLLKKSGGVKHGEIVKLLKGDHGVTRFP